MGTTYGTVTQLSVTGSNGNFDKVSGYTGDTVYIVVTKASKSVDRKIITIARPISEHNWGTNDPLTRIVDLKRDTKEHKLDGFLITDTSSATTKATIIDDIFQYGGTIKMTLRGNIIYGNVKTYNIDDDANRSDNTATTPEKLAINFVLIEGENI